MKQRGKKKKELKEMRTTSGTSGTTSNIQIIAVPEEEDKKKDQSRLDAQDKCSGLVHWDDPEGWGGEGGGRGVQDGEHM